MLKFQSGNLLYKLLVFMPFVGVISNKLNPIISYSVIIIFMFLFSFFKIKQNQISQAIFFYTLTMISVLFSSCIYQQLQYNNHNLYYIQFFGSQIIFFLLFCFFVDIKYFIDEYAQKFLRMVIYLIFLFVLLDYILISIGAMQNQFMFKLDAYSYYGKPLGLFGQFSITSSYVVALYMLYLSFNKNDSSKIKIILFIFTSLTVILQDSGTGYIVYFLLLVTIFYKSIIFRYLFIPIVFFVFLYIVNNNLFYKISYDYFVWLLDFFYKIFEQTYLNNLNNLFDFLFGIEEDGKFPIDFGPLFIIAKVGFFYFILYSLMIYYMIYKAPNRYIRMALFSLLFANLHYPAFYYPMMNLLLPVIFIYILNYDKYYVEDRDSVQRGIKC
jgi:hypothetical protein